MDLSPHFTTEEFECRCGCGLGRDPGDVSQTLIWFLEEVRSRYGPMRVTSGLRCEQHNADSEGHPNSPHLRGMGVDISVRGGENRARFLRAVAEVCRISGTWNDIGIGIAKTFIHIDLDTDLERPRVWTY